MAVSKYETGEIWRRRNMKFPQKLWNIVNDCTSGAIEWGRDGSTIVIDMIKFKSEFLGKRNNGFQTNNSVSFVRQLNLYGFRKCSKDNDVHEFRSKYFVRGREDLLKLLKRKLNNRLNIGESNIGKGVQKKQQSSEGKENSVQVTSPPSVSVENIQSFNSHFFNSTKENINPISYNWWRTPNYLGNIMYPMRNKSMEENSHLDGGNAYQERSDNSQASDNPAMYRNIVFVPVPAYYTMPSGYYSSNMNHPFIFPKKEETMDNTVSQENESF